MDTPGRGRCCPAWREERMPQKCKKNSSSSGRRRLLIIAYVCARSAARNSLASSFMYNLEIICVLKKQSARPEYSGQQQQHEWLYF